MATAKKNNTRIFTIKRTGKGTNNEVFSYDVDSSLPIGKWSIRDLASEKDTHPISLEVKRMVMAGLMPAVFDIANTKAEIIISVAEKR